MIEIINGWWVEVEERATHTFVLCDLLVRLGSRERLTGREHELNDAGLADAHIRASPRALDAAREAALPASARGRRASRLRTERCIRRDRSYKSQLQSAVQRCSVETTKYSRVKIRRSATDLLAGIDARPPAQSQSTENTPSSQVIARAAWSSACRPPTYASNASASAVREASVKSAREAKENSTGGGPGDFPCRRRGRFARARDFFVGQIGRPMQRNQHEQAAQ